MLLPDVNVWVAALLQTDESAEKLHGWLQDLLTGPEDIATTDAILISVVRVSTGISDVPLRVALDYVEAIRTAPACEVLQHAQGFWSVFADIAEKGSFRGRVLNDVAIAAIATANECTVVSYDSDYRRLPGVSSRTPPF